MSLLFSIIIKMNINEALRIPSLTFNIIPSQNDKILKYSNQIK